jgi:hypothetical protein
MFKYLQSKQFLIDMLNLFLMIAFVFISTLWFIILA